MDLYKLLFLLAYIVYYIHGALSMSTAAGFCRRRGKIQGKFHRDCSRKEIHDKIHLVGKEKNVEIFGQLEVEVFL